MFSTGETTLQITRYDSAKISTLRLSCKPCGKCFHTSAGLSRHPCSSSPRRRQPPHQRTSFKSSPANSSPKVRSPQVGSRRSSRATKVDKSYQEEEDDDEIEIVGDTELEKKNAERVDKNFSKMTLKGQREAMEAFKSFTEEEDEDKEEVENPRKVGKRGKKRRVMVEEDSDSDIEILDSPNKKRFSEGDKSEIERKEETSLCVSITPMAKTTSNNNNNNKVPISINKSNTNKKPMEEELNSNRQKQDLIQVNTFLDIKLMSLSPTKFM